MIKHIRNFRTVLSLALFIVIFTISGAQSADFSGKKIQFIVPFKEGGGTTLHARFMAPLFEKYLPGNPKILIRNMPGGAATRGTNFFARKAKDDGLMILAATSSTLIQFAIGAKSVKYDFADLVPVYTSPLNIVVYASTKYGIKKGEAEKLIGKKLVFGSRKPNGSELPVLIGFNLLGYKYKFVGGLSGGTRRQAFARGETDINYDSSGTYVTKVKRMIKKGKAVGMYTFGFLNESSKLVRDPMVKDLPSYWEVYERVHGKKIGGIEGRALKALFNARVMSSKMIVLHKKTKKSVLKAYHEAARKIINDPALKSKMGRKVLGPYRQLLGQEALRVMQNASQIDPKSKKWIANWLQDNFGVYLKKKKKKKNNKKKNS